MIPDNFADYLEPILNEVFWDNYDREFASDSVLRLFKNASSSMASEKINSLSGVGYLKERTAGNGPNFASVSALYQAEFTHAEYQASLPIDIQLIEDQNYINISMLAEEMGAAAGRTKRNHAASVFANAFTSTYAGPDAVELCDASHPVGGSTISNIGSSVLSYPTVVSTRAAMRKFTDDKGIPAGIIPDTLIVPLDLEEQAWIIANSVGKPGTGNNDANFQNGLNVIVDPYLSDTNNWFLADSRAASRRLIWFDRIMLQPSLVQPDAKDLNYYYGARMRFSYGWTDWRWVYGHSVS
jgi:phage major head subunit gpT-like protein